LSPATDLLDDGIGVGGIIQTMQHPRGARRTPTLPVHFDGAPPPVKPAPLLGQHTAEFLATGSG
jgi:crotonobetainyl-CoA:carnitine CoA-transferase CaiB-like acyl-CoA transferase